MHLPLVVDRLRRLSCRRDARVAVVMWIGAASAAGILSVHPLPDRAAGIVVGLLILLLFALPGPLLGIAAMRVERSLATGTTPGSRPASGYLGEVAVAVVTATVAVFGLIVVTSAIAGVLINGRANLFGLGVIALVAAVLAPAPAAVGVALAARGPRQMLLGRLVRLCRRREVQAIASVWVVVSVIACFFHTTDRISYPSALLANVLVGLLGPWIGVAAARVEQDLVNARAVPGLPPGLRAAKGPLRATLLPVLISSGVILDLVLLTGGAALVVGYGWQSDAFRNGTFLYIVMVFGSVPAAATLGVVVGALSRRRLVAAIALSGVIAASVAWTLWPFVTGPQLGLFNHLLGYVPLGGSPVDTTSMDEVFFFRGLTLAWAGLGVAFLALTVDDRFRLAQPALRWRRLPAGILALVMLVSVAGFELRGPSLGFDVSTREVARHFGPAVRSAHFVIHFPDGVSRREMEFVVALHERAYEKVTSYLHLQRGTGAPITSWLVGNEGQCLGIDMEGFGGFAKPWRHEIIVDDNGLYRWDGTDVTGPLFLGREIAKVVLGGMGRGPFRVSTSNGLLPNAGFEDGLAIAATNRWDILGVVARNDRQAEALLATGLARDPRWQFSNLGFLSKDFNDEILDGSFVSWLVDSRGVEAVEQAFREGDLRRLGDPAALFRAWRATLDRTPATVAERRAVELDALESAAGSWGGGDCADDPKRTLDLDATLKCARKAIAAGRRLAAAAWLRRSLVVEPELPAARVAKVRAALAEDRPGVALARLEALVDDPKVDSEHAAEHFRAEGDRRWRAGDAAGAAAAYRAAISADPDEGAVETAVKLAVASDPRLAPGLRPILLNDSKDVAVSEAQAAVDSASDSAVAEYLLGGALLRRFTEEEIRPAKVLATLERALPNLERALALGLPRAGGLEASALGALGDVRWGIGDPSGAIADFEKEAALPGTPPSFRRVARWRADRARFIAAWRARHPHWKPDVVSP